MSISFSLMALLLKRGFFFSGNGGNNEILIHRNIRVLDDNGTELIRLPEEILKPNPKHFIVEEVNETEFRVMLRQPKQATDIELEVDNCDDLKSYANFSQANGFRYKQHRYPSSSVKNYRSE